MNLNVVAAIAFIAFCLLAAYCFYLGLIKTGIFVVIVAGSISIKNS